MPLGAPCAADRPPWPPAALLPETPLSYRRDPPGKSPLQARPLSPAAGGVKPFPSVIRKGPPTWARFGVRGDDVRKSAAVTRGRLAALVAR